MITLIRCTAATIMVNIKEDSTTCTNFNDLIPQIYCGLLWQLLWLVTCSWPLNKGLNCTGPHKCRFFLVQYSTINAFSHEFFILPHDFLNWLFIFKISVNSRVLIAKFMGSQKLNLDFQCADSLDLSPLCCSRVNCMFLTMNHLGERLSNFTRRKS